MAKRKQLFAVTEINMGVTPGKAANPATGEAAVRPKSKIIPAESVFIAPNEKVEDELLSMGAARVLTKDDLAKISGRPVRDMTKESIGDVSNDDDSDGPDDDDDNDNGGGDGSDGLDDLRAEYEEVVGQKPGRRTEEKMREEIQAKKAQDLV